jgi:hypothetical protein
MIDVLNQHEFVGSCKAKYRYESLPPGQHWDEAHYPVPKCLGGVETVNLWSCDHSAHGVIQSLDLDHDCIHGYSRDKDLKNLEKYYPELLGLYEQVYQKKQSKAGQEGAKLLHSLRGEDGKSIRMIKHNQKLHSLRTLEGKSVLALNSIVKVHDQKDEEGKSVHAKKVAAITNSQRWVCLETGFISTSAGLSSYQKARNIDKSLRKQVQ